MQDQKLSAAPSSTREIGELDTTGNFQRYMSLRGKITLDSSIIAVEVLSFRTSGGMVSKKGREAVGTPLLKMLASPPPPFQSHQVE